MANVTRHSKAYLVTSFGEPFLPLEWATTTGHRVAAAGLPAGSWTVPESVGFDCVLLAPRSKPACLIGAELANLRDVLQQKNATEIPLEIKARKFFRAKLTSGQISGPKPVGSD